MSDQRHVEFTTTHLSDFAVVVMDLDGALAELPGRHQAVSTSVSTRRSRSPSARSPRRPARTATPWPPRRAARRSSGASASRAASGSSGSSTAASSRSSSRTPTSRCSRPPSRSPKAWTPWAARGRRRGDLPDARQDVDLRRRPRAHQAGSWSRPRATRPHSRCGRCRPRPRSLVARQNGFGGKRAQDRRHRRRAGRAPAVRQDPRPGQRQDARRLLLAQEGDGHLRLHGPAALAADHGSDDEGLPAPAVQGGRARRPKNVNENILVRRAKPDFTKFVGSFSGEARVDGGQRRGPGLRERQQRRPRRARSPGSPT